MYFLITKEIQQSGKKSKELEQVKKYFADAGIALNVEFTKSADDVKETARRLTCGDKKNTLIVMGGDGMLHWLINGVENFGNCEIGLIPFGTGNDFAAAAGIPLNLKKACRIIINGTAKPIDYIELSSGLRSVNAVGMGIDVDVLERAYAGTNQGKSKYLRALLQSMKHFKSKNFTVRYNGKEERHFGLLSALGNGRQIGGGIRLFPEAKLDDGYMDLVIVDYLSKFQMLRAFLKLMRGKINKVKNAVFLRVKEAEFINEDEEFTIQAEGELYKNMPITAHIVEGKLKFFKL